ncbi:MAG: hypothetical protein DIZ79_11750 [endosymbiont of Lamellibrachia luymesi]|uniref:Uncharacterized protein n=1 Tax=endosymbiont of Lamellibrachia luymesi TaxID=2200907 RepID=A0A370DX31_9GAMM|nr:MAG: hypothetical protein DIZ79_11750 [endosymbiont of Lamellibrachia luymesi]
MDRQNPHRRGTLFTLTCALLLAFSVRAELPPHEIVGFDSDEVEVREAGKYRYQSVDGLGEPPITVLATDQSNFLKIRTPEGKEVWVNQSDVLTGDLQNLKRNECHRASIAQASDRRQYGLRGVGESCP